MKYFGFILWKHENMEGETKERTLLKVKESIGCSDDESQASEHGSNKGTLRQHNMYIILPVEYKNETWTQNESQKFQIQQLEMTALPERCLWCEQSEQ